MDFMIFIKRFFTVCLLFLFLVSCNDEPEIITVETEEIPVLPSKEKVSVFDFVLNLTLEQKIAQLFLVSVDGTNAYLSATTHHVPPGGYVLFSRNTADGPEKIISLIGDTISHYAKANEVLPYFSIDHEGGDVNRLRRVSSPLPSAQAVAKTLTVQEAEELYSYSAMQLKALGIHVNIGPMAEAGYKSNLDFAGTRSYGNREKTVQYSSSFLSGFRENGIYCVVKHFPGNTNDDPHYFLPQLIGDKQAIMSLYVEPFSTLVGDDGLLMSHVIVPAYDEKNPACLSPTLIQDLVKQKLGFEGLIFSDDILMSALLENGYPPEVAISMALKAGVNVLMISHPAYWNIIPIVEELVEKDATLLSYIDTSVSKIIEAKIQMGLYTVIESNDENDNVKAPLEATSLDLIYNAENQISQFNTAKNLGDAFYDTYW